MVASSGSSVAPGRSIDDYRKGFEEEHRLLGFRSDCGFVTATWGLRCPRCGGPLEETELGRRGAIVGLSIQTVPSDEFLNDAPYAYVLVDLEGGGRVSGWIREVAPGDPLAIGDRVELVEGYRPGVQFCRGPGPAR